MAIMAFATSAFALTSCDYSEDALEPSGIASAYTLPQGDHAYDQTIVDFYKKYGSVILYKFTDKDAYWTPTGWKMYQLNEESPSASVTGPTLTCANEAYVAQQLQLLNEVWFSKFNDKMLKEFLPTKILLCDQLDSCYVKIKWDFSVTPVAQIPDPHADPVPAWYNFDNIAVAYGNANIGNMTAKEKARLQDRIMHLWPEYICTNLLKPTEEFANSAAYGAFPSSASYIKDCCALGILSETYSASAASDWRKFMIMMLNYPESLLNDANITVGQWDGWTHPEYGASSIHEAKDYQGILTSVKDTNGLVLKRYKMVRQYFIDNYGFDLQSVGNAQ